jgi:magnesium transporter
MNFRHMPELHWLFGYPLALGMMAVSAFALCGGFRKRGWF